MLKAPFNLSRARVLLTNDDGINAPGLMLLEEVVRPLVQELIVVAPEHEQSGSSHTVTMRHPLRLRDAGSGHYAVDGTPPDCVIMGVRHVMKDNPPDLVLSGINRGDNMGERVHYSGTLAACFEAGLIGIPAIGFSQYRLWGHHPNYDVARHWLGFVLKKLLSVSWTEGSFMSVNFPLVEDGKVKGVRATRLGRQHMTELTPGTDPRGLPYYWNNRATDLANAIDAGLDTDIGAVQAGYIAVSPIAIDPTHHASLEAMNEVLSS